MFKLWPQNYKTRQINVILITLVSLYYIYLSIPIPFDFAKIKKQKLKTHLLSG